MDLNSLRSRLLPYLITLTLLFLFFLPVVVGDACFFSGGDHETFFMPVRLYVAKCIANGYLPHWAPQIFGGFPMVGDPQTATFYPPNVLFSLLPQAMHTARAMDLYVVATFAMLATGMVFLIRGFQISSSAAIAAALFLALNGFMIIHLRHLVIYQTIAAGLWGSGALVRALKLYSCRWACGAGLFFASAVLAGHPHTTLFLTFGVAVSVVGFVGVKAVRNGSRKRIFGASIAILTVCAIVAFFASTVQLLPTKSHLHLAVRGKMTAADALQKSLPPQYLPTLIFPGLYQPYQMRYHFGFVAIWLAVAALLLNIRKPLIHLLFWGTALIILCILGAQGGIYPLLHKWLPGMGFVRIPTRMVWVAAVAIGTLVAVGTHSLASLSRLKRSTGTVALLFGLPATVCVGSTLLLLTSQRPIQSLASYFKSYATIPGTANPADFAISGTLVPAVEQLVVIALLSAGCTAWLYVCWRNKTGARAVLGAPGIALLFAELFFHGFGRNIERGADRVQVSGHDAVAWYTQFREQAAPAPSTPTAPRSRAVAIGPASWGINWAFTMDKDFAGGYNPVVPRSVLATLPGLEFVDGAMVVEKVLDLWNVSHLLFPLRYRSITIGSQTVKLPDLGSMKLGRSDSLFPSQLSWTLETPTSATKLHLISCVDVAGLPFRDRRVATVEGWGAAGESLGQQHVRLDDQTATSTASFQGHKLRQGKPGFQVAAANGRPATHFYHGRLSLFTTSTLLSKITVKATLPPPATWHITHLVVESDSELKVLPAQEGFRNYRLLPWPSLKWGVLERKTNLGSAWVVPQAIPVAANKSIYAQVGEKTFDPQSSVLVPPEEGMALTDTGSGNQLLPKQKKQPVTLESADHTSVTVLTETADAGWLVLSKAFHPGWTATVDGRPEKLMNGNGSHMTLKLPAGFHEINLQFQTPGYREGALISLATWITALVYIFAGVRRRTSSLHRLELA